MAENVFAGLSLSGGKRRGTALAVVTCDPGHDRLFLSELYGKLGRTQTLSSDQALLKVINSRGSQIDLLGVNVPLSLPPCLTCRLKLCPGHERCSVESVAWMRESHKRICKNRKNSKPPLPYTQRPVEIYVQERFGSYIDVPGAYSSNMSPLVARIKYLRRHISRETRLIEVMPRLSFLLLAQNSGISDKYARTYRAPEHGSEDRLIFLETLMKRNPVFVYERDLELLVLHPDCFDAFLSAYTAYMFSRSLCKHPPKDIPLKEGWIAFPEPDRGGCAGELIESVT